MTEKHPKGVPWKSLYADDCSHMKIAYSRQKPFWVYVDYVAGERGMAADQVVVRLSEISAEERVAPSVFIKHCFYGIVANCSSKPPDIPRARMRTCFQAKGLPWLWDE